jgi:hypothetical protein
LRLQRLSPPIKQQAGDDEHCRYSQQMCKRLRGRPLGGSLHASLPKLGREQPLREMRVQRSELLTRNTPRRVFALKNPQKANIDYRRVE